ncbi:Chromatin assembly factor 1, subunit A [Coemansia sp. 'formosensis']|nr:Chromatin assembly factor 1, subunit A [Coemansia sp. 'formosensis']
MYRYEPPKSFDPSDVDLALIHASTGHKFNMVAPTKDTSMHYLRQFVSGPRRPLALTSDIIPDCSVVHSGNSSELDAAEIYLLQLRKMPMKLFHFHGSQRPDYWGTWSRKLRGVGARRPFGRDTASLDYDVDSDAEWEAEEEGEDLQSEDDNDDEDSDDDADDDDFDEQHSFVVGDRMPHSELGDQSLSEDGESGDESDTDEASNFNSEDEVMEEIDSSEEVCDNGMDVDDTTEPISSRRKKAGAFASISSIDPAGPNTNFASARSKSHTHDEKKRDHPPSRRAKVLPLTPVVIGLIWNRDSTTVTILGALDALTVRAVGSALPLSVSVAAHDIQPAQPTARTILGKCEGAAGALARKSRDVTDADLHSLVGVVHGSSFGIARLVELLRPLIAGASKALIERLIHEHAVKEKRPPATRSMWYVKEQLVEQARTYQQRSGSSVISPIAHVSVSDGSEAEESAAKRQRVGEVIGSDSLESPIC